MKSESAVLKRLGPVPFWRGERKCLDLLSEIYRRAMERAQSRFAAVQCNHDQDECKESLMHMKENRTK